MRPQCRLPAVALAASMVLAASCARPRPPRQAPGASAPDLAVRTPEENPAGEEIVQAVPPGYFRAIDRPRAVPAAKARIPPNRRVIGYAAAGHARAYSLQLLDQHEIVNDEVAGRPILVTW